MATRSSDVFRLAIVLCSLGSALLVAGSLLLVFEEALAANAGIDIGPFAANLVVLATLVGACGFWILQPRLGPTLGLKVAAGLVAFGIGCLIVSAYSEPVLARAVAAGALVTGIRGAGHHIGSRLPRLHYRGAMPLGEMAALLSLAANGIVLIYLFRTASVIGISARPGYGAILALTALIVGGVLVLESLMLRFMRHGNETEILEDERDERIRDDAARVAHALLISALVLVVVQLALGGALNLAGLQSTAPGLSSPVAIAHVLLGLLFLSECGRRVAEIWLYRRARN